MKKTLICLLLTLLLIGAALLPCAAAGSVDYTVSRAFSDNMILQRDQKVAVWGWAKASFAGVTVTVTLGDISATGVVSNSGAWTVYLPPMPASTTPRDLTVKLNGKERVFHDVLVGDVWFVGGQSNAQLALSHITVTDAYPDLSKEFSEDSITRFFYQGFFSVSNSAQLYTEQEDVLPTPYSHWIKETDPGFDTSALGYFFARKVAKETGVPIGIVCIAYSGAPMATLLPAESCAKLGISGTDANPTAGAYNALAAPLIKMSMKGMLFYQGESDQFDGDGAYEKKVVEYVSTMRERFGHDFPFYNVQLSSHAGGDSGSWSGIGRTRTRQFDLLSMIPNSGLVVSMDVGAREGTADWAHPGEKQPVAERLAALALARDYKIGKEENVTSPIPVSARVTDKGIEVKFKNVGEGLKKLGSADAVYGFSIKRTRSLNTLYEASATIISKDTVLVTTTKLKNLQDVTVVYGENLRAFVDHADTKFIANLGASTGLPAFAFRIDAENMATAEPVTEPGVTEPGVTEPETSLPGSTAEPTTPATPPAETTPETENAPETTAAPESADTPVPEGPVTAKETAGDGDSPAPVGLIIGIIAAVAIIGGGAAVLILRKKKL